MVATSESPPLVQNVGGSFGFLRSHVARVVFFVISVLALFEFSTMMLSQESQLWVPSFRKISMYDWQLKAADPRIVACNTTGCFDQFGNTYDEWRGLDDSSGVLLNSSIASTTSNSSVSSVILRNLMGMEKCPATPPRLVGAVKVLTERLPEADIEKSNPSLEPGGRFRPRDCIARHKVAIILPYRDRDEHLRIFLNNIHPILQRQQLDYGIFVVEQTGGGKFNRGTLMNVGYVEAKKAYDYECFIFHDVDLLPENDKNLYSCPAQPRHMSVAIDKFNYNLPYNTILGGVSAFSDEQFSTINGFPNIYWGWGGEDDDISARVRAKGYNITRYPTALARYKMIKHGSDPSNPANPIRFDLLRVASKRFQTDGLSNLKYSVVDSQLRPLFTWLYVDIFAPPT